MPNQLPFLLSSYIGRHSELVEVCQLIGKQRLVTLLGPGGCGKTRLALAVAAELNSRFEDNVFLVELASITNPTHVPQKVSLELGLREGPTQEWLTGLMELFQGQQTLLILDNCEHVVQGCAHLAQTLLTTCPNLTILATSRESLGIAGEQNWLVPPLSLPANKQLLPTADLLKFDAIQLFVERASIAAPGFELTDGNAADIVELCSRLDGLPLAIELAAARTKYLSPRQIVDRLAENLKLLASRDPTIPPRQQTLTGALNWSYDLLQTSEAALFRQLAIFKGGFTLTAVEEVCSQSDAHKEEIFDMLSQLVDKSLVLVVERELEVRYRLLETIRQYAWEKLTTDEAEFKAVNQRHVNYYLALVRQAAPFIQSRDRVLWQSKLEAASDNVTVTLHWLIETKAFAEAAETVWLLRWFWYFRGAVIDQLLYAEMLLTRPELSDDLSLKARLCWCAGANHWILGRNQSAFEILMDGRKHAETCNDQAALANILIMLGLQNELTNQDEDSVGLVERGIALFREMGNQWGEALGLYWLADILRMRRDYAAAQPFFDQSRTLFRQIGDKWGIAHSLQGLGSVAYGQGDLSAARIWLDECLALRRVSGDKWLIAQTLNTLATVLQAQDEREAAVRNFEAALGLYQEVGDETGRIYALFKLGELAQSAGDREEARQHFQQCMALAEVMENPRRIEACRLALETLSQSAESEIAISRLQFKAFGSGTVFHVDGEIIGSSDWGYARVKELCFYLLDNGPQPKAQIGLAFWPEASPARLRRNLHDALYQLRRTLGSPDWIVYENGRYRFNQELSHSYDVVEFTAALHEPAIATLESAIAHYQADFLTDFDGEWVLLRREQLKQQFISALIQLGELYMALARYIEASETFRRAIQQDNLQEAAHRQLMRCLVQMGEPTQAVRHYYQLRDLLLIELGVEPSSETTDLFLSLQ